MVSQQDIDMTRRTRRSRRTKSDAAPAPSAGKSRVEEQGATDEEEDTKSDVAESLDSEPAEEQDASEAATPVAQNKGSASAATRRSTRSRRATSRSVQSSSQKTTSTRGKRRRPSNDSTSTATKDQKVSSKGDDDHTSTGGSEDERDSEEETQGQHGSKNTSKPQRRVKRRTSKRSNSQQSLDEVSEDGGDAGDGNSTTKSEGESQGSDDESSKKRKPSGSSRRQRKRKRPAQTAARKEKNANIASSEEEADDGTASLRSGTTSANASADEEGSNEAEESTKKDAEDDAGNSDSDDEEKDKKKSTKRRLRSRQPQISSRSHKTKKRTRSEDASSSSDDDGDGNKDAASSIGNPRASGSKRNDGKAKRKQASITDSGGEENKDSSDAEENNEESSKEDRKSRARRRLRSRQTQGSISNNKNDKQNFQGGNVADSDSADDVEGRSSGTTSGNASAEEDEPKGEDSAQSRAGSLDKTKPSRVEQGGTGGKTSSDEDNNDANASQDEEKTQKRSSGRRLRSRQPPLGSDSVRSRARQHSDGEGGSKGSAEGEEQEVNVLKKSENLGQAGEEEDNASGGSDSDEQNDMDGKQSGSSKTQLKSSVRRLRSRQPQGTQQLKSKSESAEDSDVNDAATDRHEETAGTDDTGNEDNEIGADADGDDDELKTGDDQKTDETTSSSPTKRRLRSRQPQETGDSGKNRRQSPNVERGEAGPAPDVSLGPVSAEDEDRGISHSQTSEGGDLDENDSDTKKIKEEDAKGSPTKPSKRSLRSHQPQVKPKGSREQNGKQSDENSSDGELDNPPATRAMASRTPGARAEGKHGDQVSDKDHDSVASSEENTDKLLQDNGSPDDDAESQGHASRLTRSKPSDTVEDLPQRGSRSRTAPTEDSEKDNESNVDSSAQDQTDASRPRRDKDNASSSAISRRSRRLQQASEEGDDEDEENVSSTTAAVKQLKPAEDDSTGKEGDHESTEILNAGEPSDSDDKSIQEGDDEADQNDEDNSGATSRAGRRVRNQESRSCVLTSKNGPPIDSDKRVGGPESAEDSDVDAATTEESSATKKKAMIESQNQQIESGRADEAAEEAEKSSKTEGAGTDLGSKKVEEVSSPSSLRRSKRRPSHTGSGDGDDDDDKQVGTNREGVDDSLQQSARDETSTSVKDRTPAESEVNAHAQERLEPAKGEECTDPDADNERGIPLVPPGGDDGDRTTSNEVSTLPSEAPAPSRHEQNESGSQERNEPDIKPPKASLNGQDKDMDIEMLDSEAEPAAVGGEGKRELEPKHDTPGTEEAAPRGSSEQTVEGEISSGEMKGDSISEPSRVSLTKDEEVDDKEGGATNGDQALEAETTAGQNAALRCTDSLPSSSGVLPPESGSSDTPANKDSKDLPQIETDEKISGKLIIKSTELESKTSRGNVEEKSDDLDAVDANLVESARMEKSTRGEKSDLTNEKVDPGRGEINTGDSAKESDTLVSATYNASESQAINEKPTEQRLRAIQTLSENDDIAKEENEKPGEDEMVASTGQHAKEAAHVKLPEDKAPSASMHTEADNAESVVSGASTEQAANLSMLNTSEDPVKSAVDRRDETSAVDVCEDGDKQEPANIQTESTAAKHGSQRAEGASVTDQSTGANQEAVATPPRRVNEQPDRTEKAGAVEGVAADQSDDDIDQFHDAQMELPPSEPSSPESKTKGSVLGTSIAVKEGDKMDVELPATSSLEPMEAEKYHEALSQSEPSATQIGSSPEKTESGAASPEDSGAGGGPILEGEGGLNIRHENVAAKIEAKSISTASTSASDQPASAEGLEATEKVALTDTAIAPEAPANSSVGTEKSTSDIVSKMGTEHRQKHSDDPSFLELDPSESEEAKTVDKSGQLPEKHKLDESTREAVSDMVSPEPTASAEVDRGLKSSNDVDQYGVIQYSSESDDGSDFEIQISEGDDYSIEEQEADGLSERFGGYHVNKIDRVKSKLYSIGSLAHRGRGFERKFSDYWEAMSLRLSDTLSRHMATRCQAALKAFLKTKKLRRLHNQLVLGKYQAWRIGCQFPTGSLYIGYIIAGLMERASCSTAPLDDVAEYVPREWHPRISGPKKPLTRLVTGAKKTEGDHKMSKPKCQARESEMYRQAWTEDVKSPLNDVPYMHAGSNTENLGLHIAETTSSCIPGALVVDPLVRQIVQGSGMRVNENAIWLLVVAVKAHTEAILKKVVNIKGLLENGQLQTKTALPSSATPQGKLVASTPNGQPKGRRLIGATDMCAISATMPVGPIGSFGGSLSRGVFERCLHASYDSNPVSRGKDFLEIQKFLTSQILFSASKRAKAERAQSKNSTPVFTKTDNVNAIDSSPKPELQEAEQEVSTMSSGSSAVAQRPSIRGLGRGAKNLAALKARASSGGSTELDNNSGRSQASNDDISKPNVSGNKQNEGSSTGEDAGVASQATGDEKDGESSPGSSSPGMQGRRGKGFGVKNLAAMRARSIQKPPAAGPQKDSGT